MRTEEEMLAVVQVKAARMIHRRRLRMTAGGVLAVTAIVGMIVLTRDDAAPARQQVTIADSVSGSTTSTSTSTTTSTTAAMATTKTASNEPLLVDLGLRASMEFDKPAFDLLEPITYTVHVQADEGVLVRVMPDDLHVYKGCNPDGTPVNRSPIDVTLPLVAPAPHPPGRQYLGEELGVASCRDGRTVYQRQVLTGEVAAGPIHNGPSLPTFVNTRFTPGLYVTASDGSTLWAPSELYVDAQDLDGSPNVFEVDWGDGSAATLWDWRDVLKTESPPTRSPEHCKGVQAEGSIKGESPTVTPGRAIGPQHDYAAVGTYTITVTVISMNCDGGEQQRSAPMTIQATIGADNVP